MIVKDNEDSLLATLQSLPQCVDEIVIADTGSTDDTIKIAKKFGCKVFKYVDPDPVKIGEKVYISSFAKARQFSFDKTTGDYIMWIDSDDRFYGAQKFNDWWSKFSITQHLDVVGMVYDYEHDEDGNCVFKHPRERIIKRDTHVWKSPIQMKNSTAGV